MSTPKNKPAVHTPGNPPRSAKDTRDIKRADKVYAGTALATQEPARKLTRAEQMTAASDVVLKGFETFAALLSGENVTLPMMQAGYYIIDKLWKKPIDEMRKLVNESLKTHMRENVVEGKPAPMTELVLDYGGETFKAKREVQRHKMGNAPEMADVKALAEKLGVKWEDLCVTVTEYIYDEEKTVALMVHAKKMNGDSARKLIEEFRVQKSESLGIEKV